MSDLNHVAEPERLSAAPLSLIEQFYDAAENAERWPLAFEMLATELSNRASTLVLRGYGPTSYVNLRAPSEGLVAVNPAHVFATKGLSRNNFAIAYVNGVVIDDWSRLDVAADANTAIQVFGDAPNALEDGDRALLRIVFPHLHRALRFSARWSDCVREREQLVALLSKLSVPITIVDARALVQFQNPAADELLAATGAFQLQDGLLEPANRDDGKPFREFVQAACASETSVESLALRGAPRLWAFGLGAQHAAVIIPSGDGQRLLTPSVLSRALGLTPAESRVAVMFAEGLALDEISEKLKVSVHTTRLHLKKVRMKAGAERQAKLMRHIMDHIPPIRES